MQKRFIVGIDLGTTNSAVGYIDLHDVSPGSIEIKSFDILQLASQGRLERLKTLPSFLYLPGKYEFEKGITALPWDEDRDYAVGAFARDQGALVPGRLVSSAKSWLCHGGVDRDAPILPWGSAEDVEKVSPITASARYLQHIREAWDYTMKVALAEQEVILTVPASFDEVARELTLRAAAEAGLENVTLLEEPLASFYSWLSQHEDSWEESIRPGQHLLVCDVGGGTTDFTLIGCQAGEKGPRLERLAVGNHLLLGGDNIDLAIAALAEKKISQELDPARWQMLFHQCRQAKERLLAEDGLQKTSVRIAGRGRSLVGGTLVIELEKGEVEQAILDGFFPEVNMEQATEERPREKGLREMGLPFESDPAVTRHLARFISRQGHGRLPEVILFNGGTLKPASIRSRISGVLSRWRGAGVTTIESRSLDLAISVGAVYYGLVRKGLGLRVGGGIPRSYFIGIGTSEGASKSVKAVCLIERGTEEGREVEVDRDFKVLTNRPVRFRLFSSTTRQSDHTGDIVEVDNEDFVSLPPLQTVLKYGKKAEHKAIPVHVGSQVTAIGTLELYCRSIATPHRWRLQFDLRSDEQTKAADQYQVEGVRVKAVKASGEAADKLTSRDKEALAQAGRLLEACFSRDFQGETAEPADIMPLLVKTMGMGKELWRISVLRRLADKLIDLKEGRKKSFMHEARWFNLMGYVMRPGTGEASDPWRIKALWPLHFQGLSWVRKLEPRLQWWIFWRRIAAGLSSGQQTQLFSAAAPVLVPQTVSKRKRQKKKTFKPQQEEARQMWLFAANLERLDVERKVALGQQALKLLPRSRFQKDLLWVLGRLGARIPLYGPANKVIPAVEVVSWINALKKIGIKDRKPLLNAVISMARVCGDRARDLTSSSREDVRLWLELQGASPERTLPLVEYHEIEASDKESAFGEHLPEGLVLQSEETEG